MCYNYKTIKEFKLEENQDIKNKQNSSSNAEGEFKDFKEGSWDDARLLGEESIMTSEELEARLKELQAQFSSPEEEINELIEEGADNSKLEEKFSSPEEEINELIEEEIDEQKLEEKFLSPEEEINELIEEEIDEQKLEEKPIPEQEETQSLDGQENSESDISIFIEKNPENKQNESKPQDVASEWEEINSDNDVVKKYIVYISKDFVPYIDSLTTDERSAYINDALETKIELQSLDKQAERKRRLITHLVLTFITIFIVTPFALLGVNKAILMTFANYKYSQDNFEKLFKSRFEKNNAYIRSIEYNKAIEKKQKEHSNQN